MQPPPRKVKHTTALKNIHSEQVAKLQAKHQQECDLLEDIRNFSRQRSVIEKQYAESLLKLTSGLLKRDFPATPDIATDDGQEHRTALAVWRVILEETEKLAKARQQAAEIYMEKIAEPAKPLKSAKVQCHKKVMPQLNALQQEVGQTVLEMTKSHKTYTVDENLAHDSRLKAKDANDKLARRSTGLFQSMASLQKTSAKLNSRRDACEAKSTLSRNEYLLNMAAANAHQIHYYSTDMPDLIKALDGDMYDKVKNFLSILGTASLEVSSLEKAANESIVSQADMIDRQFNHQCFLYCNHVFTDLVQYHFEPCQNDQCNKVTKDHNANLQLDKEARKWATKIAKENRAMKEFSRNLKSLQDQQAGDRLSDSGMEINSAQEVEQRIEEIKQVLRKAETGKAKAEARIEALRAAGVNVDEWIASAQAESLRAEEEEMSRTPSQVSLRTESSGGKSDDHEPTYTHYDDDDDFIDETFDVSKNESFGSYSTPTKQFPTKCRAIYDFVGSNADELDMKENEVLEIISDGDGDGWVRARNSEGKVGYIPQNYIEMQENEGGVEMQTTNGGDVADEGVEIHPVPSVELHSPESNNDVAQEVTSYSSGDIEVQMATNEMTPENVLPSPPADGIWARALYDYEAMTDEEISFTEGTLIRILRKDENGVDDGFWEGEINGKVGVFPSLVVEEVQGSGAHQLASPDEKLGPPEYVPPPPVMITAATPEREDLPRSLLTNGTESGTEGNSSRKTTEQYYRRVRLNRQQQQARQQKNYQQSPSNHRHSYCDARNNATTHNTVYQDHMQGLKSSGGGLYSYSDTINNYHANRNSYSGGVYHQDYVDYDDEEGEESVV